MKWKYSAVGRLTVICMLFVFGLAAASFAQQNPSQTQVPDADVISKSIKAIGYSLDAGSTKVVFVGTTAAPNASGEAKVDAKTGGTKIELKVSGLPEPTTLLGSFCTRASIRRTVQSDCNSTHTFSLSRGSSDFHR